MDNFLKKYRIELVTIGPVFIGSGETIRKKEWLLDKENQKAFIIDNRKFFEYLSEKRLLDSFEKFFVNGQKPLHSWLEENRIDKREYPKFTKYALDLSGVNLTKKVSDMALCIKDPYGKPYIPGSSLKGAIRNVLLAKMIRDRGYDNNDIVEQIYSFRGNPKNFLKKESRKLNSEFFNSGGFKKENRDDLVNDIMKGIRISDSDSLEHSALTLCQKIDNSTRDKERELPVVRECIKPDMKISLDMTIDTKDMRDPKITIQYIEEAIEEFLEDYNNMYLKKFQREVLYSGNVIYLGGGVGYVSKTVTNQLFSNDRRRVEYVSKIIDHTIKEKKHYEDKSLGVSPRVVKLTEYDRRLVQMGPCSIDFIPV